MKSSRENNCNHKGEDQKTVEEFKGYESWSNRIIADDIDKTTWEKWVEIEYDRILLIYDAYRKFIIENEFWSSKSKFKIFFKIFIWKPSNFRILHILGIKLFFQVWLQIFKLWASNFNLS